MYIFAYITIESQAQAEKLITELINLNLIACANIFPIKSIYKWKGNIENCEETAFIVKTRQDKYEELEKYVKENHSYEIPCITKFNVEPNKEFADWIDGIVK